MLASLRPRLRGNCLGQADKLAVFGDGLGALSCASYTSAHFALFQGIKEADERVGAWKWEFIDLETPSPSQLLAEVCAPNGKGPLLEGSGW